MNSRRSKIYIVVLSFLLCGIFTLFGCDTGRGESYLGFREEEISARVSGSMAIIADDGYLPSDALKGICRGVGSDGYSIDFSATVAISSHVASDNSESAPLTRVEFTSPNTLKGLSAARDDKGVYLDLNGVRMDAVGDEYAPLLAIAEAFLTGDSIISVNPRADGKTEVYVGDSKTDSNKTICIYTFSEDSRLPSKIDVNTDSLRISFAVKEN